MDKELELLTGLRHMLKDDLVLMKKIGAVTDGFYERDCVPMNYVLYSENSELLREDGRLDTIQELSDKAGNEVKVKKSGSMVYYGTAAAIKAAK